MKLGEMASLKELNALEVYNSTNGCLEWWIESDYSFYDLVYMSLYVDITFSVCIFQIIYNLNLGANLHVFDFWCNKNQEFVYWCKHEIFVH